MENQIMFFQEVSHLINENNYVIEMEIFQIPSITQLQIYARINLHLKTY